MRGMLAGLALCAQVAIAGEQLSPGMLAREADAVAVVRVAFGAGPPRIDVEQWLFGTASAPEPSWIGPCLPGSQLLRDWRARHPQFTESQPLWRKAQSEGGYRSVVVLRDRPEGRRPYCETESLLAQQWLAHPRHASWRESLDAALALRMPPAAAPAGISETPATTVLLPSGAPRDWIHPAGFTLSLPEGWAIRERDSGDFDLLIAGARAAERAWLAAHLSGESRAPAEIARQHERDVLATYPSLKRVGRASVVKLAVGEMHALLYEGRRTTGGQRQQLLQCVVVEESWVFDVRLSGPKRAVLARRRALEDFCRSVRRARQASRMPRQVAIAARRQSSREERCHWERVA